MFVFDASNKNTFETLLCLIDTIKEIEKSDRKGKKSIIFDPKKMIIGNKKDLKKKRNIIEKSDLKKIEGTMKFREISALTNQGIFEAFKTLI
jgi:tRNA U34 5-carboxymethylaminomethyl modifying GTPase MnmE/TrmE